MSMADHELESALFALRDHIEFPPTPALVTGVRAGIAAGEPRVSTAAGEPRRGWFEGWRAATAFAALVLAVFVAVMVFSPAARHAVADFFGLEGARINVEEGPPPEDIPVVGDDLLLGDLVTLAEAERDAGFDVKLPQGLGAPDAVYIDRVIGTLVSIVYEPTAAIPESAETGVGLLIGEFPGRIVKGELLQKTVFQGGRLDPVRVRGQQGYWISGEPHELFFRDQTGAIVNHTVRLAGNTLIWESGDLTMRLEGDLTKKEALRIARAIR